MSDSQPVLAGTLLRKIFPSGRESRAVLDGASLEVAAGEWVAVTGPSGVGKTTLLHVLAGILPPDGGRVLWDGEDLYAMPEGSRDRLRAKEAGLVFQFHHLLPDLTVEENIRLAARLAKTNGHDTAELLDRMGLAELSGNRIDKLSGGERQRVAVARAMSHRPRILFADEPTGNLDERSAQAVLDLFEQARRDLGVSIVMSTHNPAAASRAGRRLGLHAGVLSPA